MKSFLNNKQIKNRECGSCFACCYRLVIPVLNKPEHIKCKHLKSDCGGCGIYKDRPETCQTFECLWRSGWAGGTVHRPDLLGIMFTIFEHNKLQVIQAWELKKNSLDDEKIKNALVDIGKDQSLVFISLDGKKKLIGTRSNNELFMINHKIKEIEEINE